MTLKSAAPGIGSPRIAVVSTSFSRNARLRDELLDIFPDARFCPREQMLAGRDLFEFIDDAEGVIVGMELVDDALLREKPALRIVAKYGVGLDNIDLNACTRHSVKVGWTGGVNAASVAEMAVCFMLGLAHNMFRTAALLRGGIWMKQGGVMLRGRTVGIIGVGNIGKEVIRLLQPFGCSILANDIEDRSDFLRAHGVAACDKDRLFSSADIISLHVPLTDETRHLVNAERLGRMRPGGFIINTARGSVVDQHALHLAMSSGHLGGAALDVFEAEPISDITFLGEPGLMATPHIGGNTIEAVLAMGRSAIAHLESFFNYAHE